VVTLDGKDVRLGPYLSPASHRKYWQVIRVWFDAQVAARQRTWPAGITMGELIFSFWRYLLRRDREDRRRHLKPRRWSGALLDHYTKFKSALRDLRTDHGMEEAATFDFEQLKRELRHKWKDRSMAPEDCEWMVDLIRWILIHRDCPWVWSGLRRPVRERPEHEAGLECNRPSWRST
jgi:hypothetical protein